MCVVCVEGVLVLRTKEEGLNRLNVLVFCRVVASQNSFVMFFEVGFRRLLECSSGRRGFFASAAANSMQSGRLLVKTD